MKNRMIYKIAAITAASCFLVSGTAWAGETETTSTIIQEEVKTLGEKSDKSESIELINNTGKDIEFISVIKFDDTYDTNADIVKIQEALIEQGYLDDVADGVFGPKSQEAVAEFRIDNKLPEGKDVDEEMLTALFGEYDNCNLLEEKEVFKADEIRTLYIEPARELNDTEETEDAAALKKVLAEFSVEPVYILTVKFVGDDKEYIIHAFDVLAAKSAALSLIDEIMFVEYGSADEDKVSTYDVEKAVFDAQNPDNNNYNDYVDYNDYGDYSDDGSGWGAEDWGNDDASWDTGNWEYEDSGAQGADGCIEDGLFY